MSLLRLVFDDDFTRPMSLFDQNFGLGLINDDIPYQPVVLRSGYYRPWRHLARQKSGTASLSDNKEGFKVSLDVQQFKPEEVSVKTTDNCLVVEGKHEEKQDEHGFISRHFVRRYVLPEDVEINQVQCKLSSDGVLSISAPKKALPGPEKERVIPITQTHAPAVKSAQSAPTTNANKEEATEGDN